MLGIYRDISEGPKSLLSFYKDLRNSLADLVLSPEHSSLWPGCLAAGDWNLVEHTDDRTPPKRPTSLHRCTLSLFLHVKALCHLQDATGHRAHPHGFTFSGKSGRATWSSHIDCVYHPSNMWYSKKLIVIPTLWSDHKLVWAECGVMSPRVQIAKAAPQLPDINSLTKSKSFWGPALHRYWALTENKVTLESCSKFKKDILALGTGIQNASRADRSAEWKAALQGDAIPLEELPAAIEAAQCHTTTPPPSNRSCRWRSALRGDPQDAQPHCRGPDKISCWWQSTLLWPALSAFSTLPSNPPPTLAPQ